MLTGRFLEGVFQKGDPPEARWERRWERRSLESLANISEEEEERGQKQRVSQRRRVESHSE